MEKDFSRCLQSQTSSRNRLKRNNFKYGKMAEQCRNSGHFVIFYIFIITTEYYLISTDIKENIRVKSSESLDGLAK